MSGPVVPHSYQASEQNCGAACLRMLFAALGVTQDEAVIAQACGTTALGCTVQDLIVGTQSLGLQAVLLPTKDRAASIAVLTNDTPFIAMIDLANLSSVAAMLQFHFVVPLAVVQNEVMYHDPADGPDQRVALNDFLEAWATAGYRGVRVWIP